MAEPGVTLDIRKVSDRVSIVDISGQITTGSEHALMDAYARASGERTRAILLNFSGLEYMNSGGIGLLVTLLIRANRQKQPLLGFRLDDHYRALFELSRLDEAIAIHDDEAGALAAANPSGR